MKILFITHNGHPYGANKSLLTAIKHLTNTYEILLITPFKNKFINSTCKISNINFPFFPTLFYIKKKIKYFFFPLVQLLNLISFPFLLYQIIKFNPDLIYSNTSVENTGLLIAKLLRKKHITHVREFGKTDYGLICVFGERFKKWYLSKSDGLIFNSNIIHNTVFPEEKQHAICKTIYNGIGLEKTICFRHLSSEQKTIIFGIVGFIHEQKGQLKAIKYIEDFLKKYNCHLYIYGDGEKSYLKKIQNYILLNDLTNYVFLKKFISDIDKIYSAIDILLMFSKNEAFGRVTIEAMSYGIPVLGYNSGGTAEIIEHKKDGFLFSNKESFTYCLENLLENKELYSQLSKAAISKVNNMFSEETYVTEVESFVEKIINS